MIPTSIHGRKQRCGIIVAPDGCGKTTTLLTDLIMRAAADPSGHFAYVGLNAREDGWQRLKELAITWPHLDTLNERQMRIGMIQVFDAERPPKRGMIQVFDAICFDDFQEYGGGPVLNWIMSQVDRRTQMLFAGKNDVAGVMMAMYDSAKLYEDHWYALKLTGEE